MTRTWTVSEATHSTAFLSDSEGHDIATLQRMPCELYDTAEPLTENEWQAVIDLVAAAHAMRAALQQAKSMLIELYEEKYPDDETDNEVTEVIDKAIAALNTAEGKDRILYEN